MKPSPEIAIIDANTLTCMGLRGLIERMMPMATVRTFNSFEQLVRDTPDMYFHYFISAQTLLEHSAFFIERKEKTIVLTNGTAGTPQTSHFHTLNIYQSEDSMVRALLQLQQHAHAHGRHLPQNMPRPYMTNTSPGDPNGLSTREIEVLTLIVDQQGNCRPLVHQHHNCHFPPQEHYGETQCPFRIGSHHLCGHERVHRGGPYLKRVKQEAYFKGMLYPLWKSSL